MDLARLAWTTTVVACVLGAVALLLSGYQGYGAVTLVVAVAAAINLR